VLEEKFNPPVVGFITSPAGDAVKIPPVYAAVPVNVTAADV
jgi:hypothetical protein